MKKLFKFLFLIWSASSCETVIPLEFSFTPQIGLYGLISTDSTVRVFVYETTSPLTESPVNPLSDASVHLFEDDVLLGELEETSATSSVDGSIVNGIYMLDYIPRAGKKYRIEVGKDGFEDAWAETRIPTLVSQFEVKNWSENDIQIQISDVEGLEFYEIWLTQERYYINTLEDSDQTIQIYQKVLDFESESDLFEGKEPHQIEGESGEIFSNNLFVDREFDLILSYRLGGKTYWDIQETSVYVEIRSITHDYYQHRQTLFLQNTGFNDVFASPVQVYQNVNGGLGIFAGYNNQVVKVRLE